MANQETIFTRFEEPVKPAPPAARPIETLNTDIAHIYTHIHPLLVISVYALQFNAIVNDPVPALLGALVPLSALQIIYSIICLPAAGSASASKSGKGKKTASKADGSISSKVSTAVISLVLSTMAGIPLLTALLILFGAPLTTHLFHTLLCAAHISYLAAVPTIYAFGVDGAKWRELVALKVPVDDVFGAAVGTLIGAWAGAVPIPLDWDREWQKWPVTIVCGAYAGFTAGKLLGSVLLRGKTFAFN
ncbi:uncharacterized protein K452DRAFT_361033 [Aplosporella prunicola CBS 121167]|uniref:Glycosylphosphatidylinositol anchor biosynthesis protein 11 n=1 Tax=Aplosporella prunicola CBS 121167 TaxID=1176127 RepID=A0A6A6B6D6_9PEZI|nr:uncharacterized protein K452DRAFT_361033 [Aplosporella prunicola CBS 121167]KAF2138814.1 hypothetical protein K452DRAFT_361033 [Aplosporella prunicola CBS 121167]